MKNLVIVESPTKAKTIAKFLGKNFHVESSYGHIRDLPKSKMGVDIENDFEPQYIVPKEAKKQVTNLKKLAKTSGEVILATDEDREGEAISWHLAQVLDLIKKPIKRIVFHEITRGAINEAIENPRELDLNLVDAQQARRVLDRLVGYELSPFLWKKVKRGLSAGRVQSVALRMIVEREREIEKFTPEEYWTIEAKLFKPDQEKIIFTARLNQIDGKTLKKFDVHDKGTADKIVKDLKNARYMVSDINQKEVKRFPSPPFTTSTLQQEAARKLGFSGKQTMMIAQKLYETGFITYMRTDSFNLSQQALDQAREFINNKYGKEYTLSEPRRYKTKSKGAQEAHEAIRPTDFSADASTLEKREARLYELIWKRTVACQMQEAVFDQTSVDIAAGEKYVFRATGQVVKFDGFIKVYTEGKDEEEEETTGLLPKLSVGDKLEKTELGGLQHFTVPPPRYTDATLVKALEEYGIGRPSTYAPTIATVLQRGYIERKERKFFPTEIGIIVNDILVKHFPQIVDFKFTAKMEEELDEIAEGKLKWRPVIRSFYEPFKKNLETKKKTVEKKVEMTDIPCPECQAPMVKKFGRFGPFLACSRYPECKGSKPLPEEEEAQKKLEAEHAGKICPECKEGNLVVKRSRFGPFLGCSRYPECKYTEKIETKSGVKCPKCGEGELVMKKSRRGSFWACNRYPDCKFTANKLPDTQNAEDK